MPTGEGSLRKQNKRSKGKTFDREYCWLAW